MARIKKTAINTSLPEFSDEVLFDYNKIIEQCCKQSNDFTKLIYYLNSTSLKINPTKIQYIIIKEAFTKFNIELPEPKLIELEFIDNYPDYVVSICSNEDEIEQVYLSMLKLSYTKDRDQRSKVIDVLNSNKHHFSKDLKSKIIKELFIKIDKLEDRRYEYRFIVETIKLLITVGKTGNGDNNGCNDEIFKKQEIQIKEIIKSPSFTDILRLPVTEPIVDYDIKGFVSFEVVDWIIQSFGGNQVVHPIIYIYFLIYLEGSSSGNDHFLYMDKYQNQIIESINNNKQIVYELELGKFNKLFESILSILIISKQFNYNSFKILVNKSVQLTVYGDLKTSFRDWLTFDVLVDVLVELYCCGGLKLIKQSDLNKFISKHFKERNITSTSMDNITTPRHRLLSAFQINEDKFIHKLDQDEFTLLEIYKSNFRILFSNLPIDTDFAIPVLFSNLSTSPIKRSFHSEKIEYLIEICNLNIINNWILPNFNDECMRSKTYQLKSTCVNLQSINKQLSSVLIDEIFKQYLNNNSTSMYQKLQLSLVSKKSFQRVKSLLNDSMDVPVTLSCLRFTLDNCDGKYSLFDCSSIRYLKFYVSVGQCSEQAYRFLYTLLGKCKSIEILQLSYPDPGYFYGQQFEDFAMLFNWINWYNSSNGGNGKLKKLLFQIDHLFSLKSIQEFQTLNSDIDISIQLILQGYSIKEAKEESIEFDKFNITNLNISINNYFHHGSLKINGISTIKNLKLSINFCNHSFKEEEMIKYFKKYSKNWINQQDGSTSLSNLKTLELAITTDPTENSGNFIFYKELINYFGSKISSNLKEIIISFYSISITSNPTIEMIFKLISDNPQFNNVSQISIPTTYSNSILHSLNKLSTKYSFIQQPLNYNRSNSIEFIRKTNENKQVCQIKNNKRKFDEIDKQQEEEEQEEEEEIDFNTDSEEEEYEEEEDEDEDEDETSDDSN